MTSRRFIAVASATLLVPLFAACSQVAPIAVPAPATPVSTPTVDAPPTESPSPVSSATATPAPTPSVDAAKAAKEKAAQEKAARDKAAAEKAAKDKAAAEKAAKAKAAQQAKDKAEGAKKQASPDAAKKTEAPKKSEAPDQKRVEQEAAAKAKAAEAAGRANAATNASESENKADTQASAEGTGGQASGPVTISDACATSSVTYRDKGNCANEAMAALKAVGYYSGKVDGTFGTGAANWTVHYQRSRGLPQTGQMNAATWAALKAGKPAIAPSLASSCKGAGVNVCVHLPSQTLYWVKDGDVQKTIKVRTAGWNQDKNGRWRMHGTGKGTFTVYNKAANPSSPRYGEGAMPYSTMFDPNMYFHYSAGFAKVGYSGSSHGCVNIASKADAKWIMDNTPIGAKVRIY